MDYIHGAEYFSIWRTWKTWATQHMSDSSSLIYALQFVAWLAQATLPSIVFKGPPRSSHRILKQDENSTWDFNLTFLICVGSWESGNGFSLDRTEPCVKASRFYMILYDYRVSLLFLFHKFSPPSRISWRIGHQRRLASIEVPLASSGHGLWKPQR